MEETAVVSASPALASEPDHLLPEPVGLLPSPTRIAAQVTVHPEVVGQPQAPSTWRANASGVSSPAWRRSTLFPLSTTSPPAAAAISSAGMAALTHTGVKRLQIGWHN